MAFLPLQARREQEAIERAKDGPVFEHDGSPESRARLAALAEAFKARHADPPREVNSNSNGADHNGSS
jgi:hypothetical protein